MIRKNMLTIALVAFTLLMAGCEKNNEETRTPQELLLGKWNVVLDQSFLSYTDQNYDETLYCSEWADYITIEFKSDTLLTYTTASGGATGWVDSWDDAYNFANDTLKWGHWNYHVSVLDEQRLVMESVITEDHPRRDGTVLHTAEIKHYEMERME